MSIPFFKPAVGGAEEWVYQVSKRLIKRGHEITIFTSDLLKTRPKYVYLDTSTFFNENEFLLYRFHAVRLLQNYFITPRIINRPVLRKSYDIIHANVYGCFMTDYLAIVSLFNRIPLVVAPHGFSYDHFTHPFAKLYISLSKSTLGSLKIAKKIICVSKYEAIQCKEIVGNYDKIRIIPVGIDIEYWSKQSKKGSFRCKYDIQGPIIACAGRITEGKGFQYLIRSIPIISKEQPKVCVVIAGEDFGYLKKLKELSYKLNVQDRVLFTGLLTKAQLKELFTDAEVVVIPSVYGEGLPRVMLEAMAMGKPIVASNAEWASEVIKHGTNGFLIDPKNRFALAEVIVKLLQDREFARKIGEINKREARKYSWDFVIDKLEDLYKEALCR
jgi:glycosyltransferase involved in cell wall biosynthesis